MRNTDGVPTHISMLPVPRYGSIREAKLQPAQLLEIIQEDVEPETASQRQQTRTKPCLTLARQTLPIISYMARGDANFSPPGEIEYMRRVKRVGIDEFPRGFVR
ncbi:hypothetical protein BDR06DRAFT_71645 [Suillus hirtellus]|nr:hypothetical protein BDR06DRAFT_71645 [Suillus hirtellus]